MADISKQLLGQKSINKLYNHIRLFRISVRINILIYKEEYRDCFDISAFDNNPYQRFKKLTYKQKISYYYGKIGIA